MEVKKGCKLTEFGVIPEDWETSNIGEQIDLLTGFPFPSNKYSQSGVKLLRGSNIKRGVTDWSEDITQYWDEIYPSLKKYLLNIGDIVIAMDGSLVGRSFACLTSADLPALLLQRVARVRSKKIDIGYLKEFICSDYFTKHCDSVKTVTAIPHISPNDIKCFKIPLPPTVTEQTTIANALSDADELLQSLEKLIAKKRAIKQGALQDLLNPKEGWVVRRLEELADSYQKWSFTGGPFGSNLKSSDYTDEGIRIIQLQNIGDGSFINDYAIYTSKEKADELISCNIYPGEIILSKMGDPVARACIIPELHERYLMCSDGIRLAVNKKEYYPYFIYTYINSPIFRVLAENASTGSTRKRIGLNELRNIELTVPLLSEQKYIATILSDMDAEIAALKTKLAKYKQIKLGMMQNLLTGRIRLI